VTEEAEELDRVPRCIEVEAQAPISSLRQVVEVALAG
jgi:hypothetical protein